MNPNTELTTFRVKEGKEARAQEWMRILQQRRADCIETLPREKMGYESVFKVELSGRLYLTWFSVQGEGAEDVDESEHEVDKIHCQFWEECIDQEFDPHEHEHVVSFCLPTVEKEILGVTSG